MVWISLLVITIAVIGGLGYLFHRSGLLGAPAHAADVAVAADDHYVVFLSQVEVESQNAKGRKWDVGEAAPDIRYDIYWKGNRIFRSSVRKDTLLARWDPDEVGIDDLIHGVSSERSLKAARITARHGETLEFRVVDDDTFSDDEIGRWEVSVDSLHTGDQTWNAPAPGIRQAICRVLRFGQTGR